MTLIILYENDNGQYVNHADFKIWGVGLKVDDGDTEWYGADEYEDVLLT